PTTDDLEDFILTQSEYDLMREVNPNDQVGGVSGRNRPSPRQSKLRRRVISKKENPTTSELSSNKERKSESLNTPLQIIIISPENTPDKLPAAPGPENLTENVSLEEAAAAADLIKQTKAELGIQPSAVEQQDAPKDATLK
ncbi:hypothetical protein XENOCAPTIV_022607, partial [Xenoophorus captivus]